MTTKTETKAVAPTPYQDHFALEGTDQNGHATMLRCTHHIEDPDRKNEPLGMSEATVNLGDVSLWLCTACNVRLREAVLTSVLVDSGRLILRNDPDFAKELTERMRSEREAQ